MLQVVKSIINSQRDPQQEIERFNEAQEKLDFTTMYDVLFHTAAQYCKKRGQGKYWSTQKICDVSNDVAAYILKRYKKNPNYRCKHMAAVHFAWLHIVYGDLYKQDQINKLTQSYDAIPEYVTDFIEYKQSQ